MILRVSKWGNSLALRIPADYVRSVGLKDGDDLQASLTVDGGLCVRTSKWDRSAFAKELAEDRGQMTMGTSVMDEIRQGARY